MNIVTSLKALLDFKCPKGRTCFLTERVCESAPCPPILGCRVESTTIHPPPILRAGPPEDSPLDDAPLIVNPCFGIICRTGYVCKLIPAKDCKKGVECPPTTSCVLAGHMKPGSCPIAPVNTGLAVCVEECGGDDSCPGIQKCCPGCPTTCRTPEFNQIAQATTTEAPRLPVITCEITLCSPGYVCRDEPEPCGEASCPTRPRCNVAPVKPGSCPVMVEETPCRTGHRCGMDDNCEGDQKCCGVCGMRCVDAVTTTTATTTQSATPRVHPLCMGVACAAGYECRLDPPQCQVPGCVQREYCAVVVKDCTSEPETGRCKAWFPRWHYNSASETCEQFIYGGCGGNANNYITEALCLRTCKPECPPWTPWNSWVDASGIVPCLQIRTRTSRLTLGCRYMDVQRRGCDNATTTTTAPAEQTAVTSTVQSTTEAMCKDGETPLPGLFCGRGPTRQDCPSGYECNIHPADRYAVCCPTIATTTSSTTTTARRRTTAAAPTPENTCEYEAVPREEDSNEEGMYRVKTQPWIHMTCPSNLVFMDSLCFCDYPSRL